MHALRSVYLSFGELNVTNTRKKLASNIEINKGNILLLFGEDDAKIVRNWRHEVKPDRPTHKSDIFPG
jgi:hypothetical protein